jgi:hypothetical protein
MIKSIAGGQGIEVSNSGVSHPYFNMSTPSAGLVRYNGNNQNFEVYDGNQWMTIQPCFPLIQLTRDVHELLQWARERRDAEYRIKELVEKHPVLLDAKQQLDVATSQFEMLVNLVKNHTQKENIS